MDPVVGVSLFAMFDIPVEFPKKHKNRVLGALEGTLSFKKLSTVELHQYVQNYNYDDGLAPLQWIVQQPHCDRGTALCLFWHLQPDHFYPDNDETHAQYRLLKDIETRFLGGFYASEQFSFDPRAEFIEASMDLRGLPLPLLERTPGVGFPRVDVEMAFLRSPNEKEVKAIGRKLDKALQILRLTQPGFAPDEPDVCVAAVAAAVEHWKEGEPGKLKLLDLSFLWLDCLVRQHGWSWVMWDWETSASYGATNPSRKLTCLADTLVRHTRDGFQPISLIGDLYRDLAGADDFVDLKQDPYSGIGLLFSSSHLSFRTDQT